MPKIAHVQEDLSALKRFVFRKATGCIASMQKPQLPMLAKNRRHTGSRHKSIQAIDLFCGAGGLTFGLRKAGIKVIAGFDFDAECLYPFEFNNPGSRFFHRDLAIASSNEIANLYDATNYRVLVGCAPCQPFSTYSRQHRRRENTRLGAASLVH